MNSHLYVLIGLSTLRTMHILSIVSKNERKKKKAKKKWHGSPALGPFFINPNYILHSLSQGRKFCQSVRKYFPQDVCGSLSMSSRWPPWSHVWGSLSWCRGSPSDEVGAQRTVLGCIPDRGQVCTSCTLCFSPSEQGITPDVVFLLLN